MDLDIRNIRFTKMTIVVICVAAALLSSLVAGATLTVNSYKTPQTGIISTNFGLVITINGQAWANGTTVDWGTLTPGQSISKAVTFQNTGTVTINTITLAFDSPSNLPSGWVETLSALPAGGLAPGATASGGSLTLTPSASAVAGSYSWTSYFDTT